MRVAEYLAIENAAQRESEFIAGEMIEREGATRSGDTAPDANAPAA